LYSPSLNGRLPPNQAGEKDMKRYVAT